MGLDLSHRGYVTLGDLVVVLHIVLDRLVVVILHFLAGYAAYLRELVGLIISFGHRDLVL